MSGALFPRLSVQRALSRESVSILRLYGAPEGGFRMHAIMRRGLALLALVAAVVAAAPGLAQTEKRVALVVGNSAYQQGALATAANDAGLIAQTLQAAGFDVMGA